MHHLSKTINMNEYELN